MQLFRPVLMRKSAESAGCCRRILTATGIGTLLFVATKKGQQPCIQHGIQDIYAGWPLILRRQGSLHCGLQSSRVATRFLRRTQKRSCWDSAGFCAHWSSVVESAPKATRIEVGTSQKPCWPHKAQARAWRVDISRTRNCLHVIIRPIAQDKEMQNPAIQRDTLWQRVAHMNCERPALAPCFTTADNRLRGHVLTYRIYHKSPCRLNSMAVKLIPDKVANLIGKLGIAAMMALPSSTTRQASAALWGAFSLGIGATTVLDHSTPVPTDCTISYLS